MITVTKATAKDIVSFVKNIRSMDAEETFMVSGKPIETRLAELYAEEPKVIKCNDVIIGIGGVKPEPVDWNLKAHWCLGWMLLTNEVEKHKIEFLKWSKRYVEGVLKDYSFIYNHVYAKNKLHIEYLKFLGAEFYPDYFRKDLLTFVIERR